MISNIALICGVLSLALFADRYLASAPSEISAIEKVIKNTMKEFDRNMMDSLQAYLQHNNNHMEQQCACDKEFEILRNISRAQEEEVLRKITSFEAKVDQIIESGKQFEQRYKADLEKLLSTNEKILALNSDMKVQLKPLQDELEQVHVNMIPPSCASVNSKDTDTYYINPSGWEGDSFLVLCNFEKNFNLGGGWTVFQRRIDGSVDFYQNWESYKNGFGDVNGEHWLGLEKLHLMTKSGRNELLLLLEDFEGKSAYAFYDEFKVASEAEKYKLTVGKHSGTADDSLTLHNGMKFTTSDQDNNPVDGKLNCAIYFKGAWWFEKCYKSHLNGQYYQKGNHLDKKGVHWHGFPRADYSLKSTTMMFRRRN